MPWCWLALDYCSGVFWPWKKIYISVGINFFLKFSGVSFSVLTWITVTCCLGGCGAACVSREEGSGHTWAGGDLCTSTLTWQQKGLQTEWQIQSMLKIIWTLAAEDVLWGKKGKNSREGEGVGCGKRYGTFCPQWGPAVILIGSCTEGDSEGQFSHPEAPLCVRVT